MSDLNLFKTDLNPFDPVAILFNKHNRTWFMKI